MEDVTLWPEKPPPRQSPVHKLEVRKEFTSSWALQGAEFDLTGRDFQETWACPTAAPWSCWNLRFFVPMRQECASTNLRNIPEWAHTRSPSTNPALPADLSLLPVSSSQSKRTKVWFRNLKHNPKKRRQWIPAINRVSSPAVNSQ